jgi:hypothetical protein
MEFEALSLSAAEFPRRWIDYTCLDVIALSLDELHQLSQKHGEAFQAIRRWTRTGGQLWVHDVGQQFERLSELSKLLKVSAAIVPQVTSGENADSGDAAGSFEASWRPVRFVDGVAEGQVVMFTDSRTGTVRTVRDPAIIARLRYDPNYSMTGQRYEADEDRPRIGETNSSRWFVEQRMGLGRARAFRGENEIAVFLGGGRKPGLNAATGVPDSMGQNALAVAASSNSGEGQGEEMPPSLAGAVQSVTRWDTRHGLAPDDANLQFANFLVEGVGVAPVTEFRILITLFVLLIGPVNYWLLNRWRRLHLMVLTVPLAAAVITVALFAYAIISDGFGTTVRAHSFTTFDQRTGDAACWTRLSYYAGLTPGAGLTMPADVVLYPIIPSWSASNINAQIGTARDVVWREGEARLTRGWLRSRTPTQYLTIRSRTSPHRLELTPARGRLRAKNELGTTIKFLVVLDDANKVWASEQLGSGAVVFLQSAERSEAVRKLRKLVTEHTSELPAALAGNESEYAAMQRAQWRMYSGQYGADLSEHNLDTNLANDALTRLAGLAGQNGLTLPPRSYVAVTATGPEVEFGMKSAEEQASFHVIVGQW